MTIIKTSADDLALQTANEIRSLAQKMGVSVDSGCMSAGHLQFVKFKDGTKVNVNCWSNSFTIKIAGNEKLKEAVIAFFIGKSYRIGYGFIANDGNIHTGEGVEISPKIE
jgi:hypothetical protein